MCTNIPKIKGFTSKKGYVLDDYFVNIFGAFGDNFLEANQPVLSPPNSGVGNVKIRAI